MRSGTLVYSPIAHCHIPAVFGLPKDFVFWRRFDEEMISRCNGIIVLKLSGWDISVGVNAEIKIAEHMGKRVVFVENFGALTGVEL